MKRLYPSLVVIGLTILLTIQGCEKEGNSEFSSQVEYYKYNQLKNIYENEITPLSSFFITEAEQLLGVTKTFQMDVTATNLVAVQEQWKSLQMVWKQLELYDLGAVADSFVAFEINRWPTDTSRIDENISGTENIDADFIASIGSSSKGISGLEYLLFPPSSVNALGTFTTDENAERRMSYLVALSENLLTKSEQLNGLWEANETTFTRSLENGISGSQNQVINAMVTLIEEVIISKLGNPLGDSNGGMVEAVRLEAHRSGISKEIVQQHLTALRRCYRGDFAQTPFRVGFDDFLELIGSENFAIKITDQFSECQSKLDVIEGSFEDEITVNSDAVVDLKNSFRDLLVLIKVDMANVLGSTITFNDNDGD